MNQLNADGQTPQSAEDNDFTTKNATPHKKDVLGLPSRLENRLEMIENIIGGLEGAAEAIAAIGEAGENDGMSQQARGLSWAAEKLGVDVMSLQESFSQLRAMVYEAAPAVKAEADRIAAEMAKACGAATLAA
jgi:hypothetical protein